MGVREGIAKQRELHSEIIPNPVVCSQWFVDILRTGARANVNAFTTEYWVGLELGRLERVRVLKLRAQLWVWMDIKGNSELPWGFDERGDTVRAAGEKNEFGSCMKD